MSIRGYIERTPEIELSEMKSASGEVIQVATIDCESIYYRNLNQALRQVADSGITHITLTHVNGQRYIGTALLGDDLAISVEGTAGQDLAMLLSGPRIEIQGNAQDGVANTMNDGEVIVHGSVGDAVGYGMRGGMLMVRGDAGYRAGIHMKEYEDKQPKLVIGGRAQDFLGEYMAGGTVAVLGLDKNGELAQGNTVGSIIGVGMGGGTIYVREASAALRCGEEAETTLCSPATTPELTSLITKFADEFAHDFKKKPEDLRSMLLAAEWSAIVARSARPFASLYTSM